MEGNQYREKVVHQFYYQFFKFVCVTVNATYKIYHITPPMELIPANLYLYQVHHPH